MNALPSAAGTGLAGIAERVLADLDPLLVAFGAAYRAEIPEYAALSEGQMVTEVLPVSRVLVVSFLERVVDERPFRPREIAAFEAMGRTRFAMGLPLDALLHAFRICGREAWRALCDAVQPGEERFLGPLGSTWLDAVDVSASAAARAYVAASHERLRDLDARRRELVEALLSAGDPGEVAAVSLRFSTVLAPAYVPVVVAGDGTAARIDTLLAASPPGTLGGHRGDRVLLLVPHRLEAPLARPGALVACGEPAAVGPRLLDEVAHVERVLATALAEGHTTGSFGPDDLLVEQLLLGNDRVAGALRRRVLGVLQARDPGGQVVLTLRRYLVTGSVPETARQDNVHANTVAYRLGRVRDLTGLDPRVPRDAALLVLGLGLPEEEQP